MSLKSDLPDLPHRPKSAAEALERRVKVEMESARRHAAILGLDDAGTEARVADAERRTRERFARYFGEVATDKALPDSLANTMARYGIEYSEPLTWPPDEVETIMRASWTNDTRVHDDREREWQVIHARGCGYPSWFSMTCGGLDGAPRTAGPETKEWHDRKAEIERSVREDMPRLREEIRAAFQDALKEAPLNLESPTLIY